jgi:SPP1 gp7 family putative phage head morphogenesis protein
MSRMFNDYPEREGLCPRMVYWMFFKRFDWRHRMVLTELFGLPWRIVERDKDVVVQEQPEGMDDDVQAAEGLGGTSVASMRAGVRLRVERPDPKSVEFFKMTSDDVNEELRKLINGQAATMEGDANRASASVARTDEDALRLMDGRGLEERFQQQLVVPFVEMNWGKAALQYAPKFTLRTEPPRDRKSELERVEKVLAMGVPVSENEIYEISGLRKPMHGEPVVRQAAGAAPAPGAGGAAAPAAKEETAPGDPKSIVESVLEALDGGLMDEPLPADDAEDADAKLSRLQLSAAPPYGSVEHLVVRGAREGAKETTAWASRLAEAAGDGGRELDILRAVTTAAKGLDVGKLARALERRIVHSLMLGALDANWEAENDEVVKPPSFLPSEGKRPARVLLDEGGGEQGEPDAPPPAPPEREFATRPFAQALSSFIARKVIPRAEFDRLGAEAKRRAFTVAGLARDEMLETVHKQLTASMQAGEDLRGFKARLSERFDEAGWTKLNSSHVETVFRNATMSAYSSGRVAQMKQPTTMALRPFWQVLGVNDSRTRPSHRALHGKVFPAGAAPQPPYGHNCRCRLVSRSAKDVERLGLSVMALSGVSGVPDPGWDDSGLLE